MRKIVYKQKYFSVITKNSKRGLPKKGGGLGQFVDLRRGGVAWQEKGGRVFEGGVDTPMHTDT